MSNNNSEFESTENVNFDINLILKVLKEKLDLLNVNESFPGIIKNYYITTQLTLISHSIDKISHALYCAKPMEENRDLLKSVEVEAYKCIFKMFENI